MRLDNIEEEARLVSDAQILESAIVGVTSYREKVELDNSEKDIIIKDTADRIKPNIDTMIGTMSDIDVHRFLGWDPGFSVVATISLLQKQAKLTDDVKELLKKAKLTKRILAKGIDAAVKDRLRRSILEEIQIDPIIDPPTQKELDEFSAKIIEEQGIIEERMKQHTGVVSGRKLV